MSDLSGNRIVKTFAELRATDKRTLMPFVTAGYPDLATTAALLSDFEARGVRIVEIGVPFSDPIADGPTIQASYTEALAGGVDCGHIFEMVRSYRDGGGELALVSMVSYSIVFKRGAGAYLDAAVEAGFDGLIVPDLPMEEAGDFEALAADRGLANILLIAPTSPTGRRAEIAAHCRGFIYYVSVAGITGERDKLPESTIQAVAELRKKVETPVCVGFGVSNADTVAHVCEVADGAIVGSAIIHRITDAIAAGLTRDQLVAKVGDFVSELLAPLP